MVAINTELGSPAQQPIPAGPAVRAAASRLEAQHDAELVTRFNSGDDDAFAEIVTRYRGKMYSIALSHLRNHADAEEIAQDTFIRAYRGLARFRGDSSLATWLHRIAFNLSRNRYKYYFCRRRHAMLSLDCAFEDDSGSTFSDLIASDTPTPARAASTGEFSSLVVSCMEKLGTHQREILNLRNAMGQSYGEIAGALGISVGTVKSRIGRAREKLRGLLAMEYPDLAANSSSFDWFEPNRSAGKVGVACS
jgi:RNA polymerase sigma-70 factor (ECF subfamily)